MATGSVGHRFFNWNRAVLTQKQLSYAALDAWLTLKLWKAQLPRLKKTQMERVHQVESQVLPAVAEAHLTGIRLVLKKTRTLLFENRKQLHHLAINIEQILEINNINSPKQMANAIEARGHKLPTTEAGNKSASDQSLRSLYVKDSELTLLRQYRSFQKTIQTYLLNWISLAESNLILNKGFIRNSRVQLFKKGCLIK